MSGIGWKLVKNLSFLYAEIIAQLQALTYNQRENSDSYLFPVDLICVRKSYNNEFTVDNTDH